MTYNLKLTEQELLVIQATVNSITIKGSDSKLVGGLLEKVDKGLLKINRNKESVEQ